MISSKKNITPAERKERVQRLRQEHQPYFDKVGLSDALFIPKMAYRPPGKDELYISFFPSELENECDIYTEFVSIDYKSEDPKRTLYLVKHNPFWKDEYEIITSNSGHARHFIPVNELKVINTLVDRKKSTQTDLFNTSSQNDIVHNITSNKSEELLEKLINVLEDINYTLAGISRKINR